MSYIGRQPQIGNFQICDAISVVNNQAAYTMQVSSVNVSPETANHMIVSLNGVIQAPISSYTISGSTITFAANLVTGDVINFIQILGDVLDLGVPSDATVTTAKLASTSVTAAKLNADVISGTTALTAEPADTDEFLVSDAGVLKRIDYSLIKGGGITMADQWRITTTFTGNADPIANNWEQVDVAARLQGTLGSAMSQSSGIFTFPATGIYLVTFNTNYAINGNERSVTAWINATTDNSTYAATAYKSAFIQQTDSNWTASSAVTQALVDVQDTSNDKVKFEISVQNSNTQTQGSTNETVTGVTFIRLGDT